MADYGATERVRRFVVQQIFEPAKRRGERSVTVHAGTLGKLLEERNILPANRYPIICGAMSSPQFAKRNHARLEAREGPRSGLSSAATFTFVLEPDSQVPQEPARESQGSAGSFVSQGAAFRKLRGVLRQTYLKLGGAGAVHIAEQESWER